MVNARKQLGAEFSNSADLISELRERGLHVKKMDVLLGTPIGWFSLATSRCRRRSCKSDMTWWNRKSKSWAPRNQNRNNQNVSISSDSAYDSIAYDPVKTRLSVWFSLEHIVQRLIMTSTTTPSLVESSLRGANSCIEGVTWIFFFSAKRYQFLHNIYISYHIFSAPCP